ncbi:alpha/beta hydrolase [Aureimonas altamirensis]|uniref:alpha/beta hydrolase n=1 Tax=Aureimonas altamirensis TaxID=370622 RepID=UPI001E4D7C45|nr:alpha/beta hydrolase [Aureimonas altamirensis]UHD44105.1 alpha/beta hydrolase [Aureimonas altamirensis]
MHSDHLIVDQPAGSSGARENTGAQGAALGSGSTLGDILNHPAFAGFARQMLPWDGRAYDSSLPLRDIDSLLPYHSHVEPAVVLAGLNRMIADVAAGRTIFYDIYSAAQKQAQPLKQNTGLFFFRGRPGAPFAIIAPGGGFAYVGSVHEGFPYAQEISSRGYNAFVLKYRAGQGGRIATEDLAAAISFVFRNAKALQVGTEDYSLWGSSAGARMAAFVGSHGVAAFGGDVLPKPSTVVTAYTAHSDTSSDEPPTFVVVGEQDGITPPSSMQDRIAILRRDGAPVEFHRYPNVGHGFGTGAGTSADGWISDAVRFWEKHMQSNAKQEKIP